MKEKIKAAAGKDTERLIAEDAAARKAEFSESADRMESVLKSGRFRKKQRSVIISIIILCAALNAAAWISEDFSLFYTQKIFPVITTPFAWLTSRLPFSLGEVLIIIAVIGVPLSLLLFTSLMIVKRGKRDAKKKIRRIYAYVYAWIFVYILLTETLNCFILYHTPTFAEIYGYAGETYSASQLEELADFLIDKTNSLSERVQRDEKGQFVMTDELVENAKSAMLSLSEEIPQLSGYYAEPKIIKNSFFMSQQYLMGIYFPFTMEANYNYQMYALNVPDTLCHELAHTKGIIREDEANFAAFLACDGSESVDFQYSGYLRALKYVLSECGSYCSEETTSALYNRLSDGVRTDWQSNSEYWQEVQESDEGLISSETVAKVSDKAMETSLKLNGVDEGKRSYGRMVDLLLDWYFAEETQ